MPPTRRKGCARPKDGFAITGGVRLGSFAKLFRVRPLAPPSQVRFVKFELRFDEVASSSYFINMRAVGLKTLKNKLSEYVRLAGNGETVLVTDRDRVVAELSPPRTGRSAVLADAMLAEAMRRGWVTPPALVGANAPPRKPIMAFRALMEELRHDRDDR
jgi:antitoxin (DNA-binding transcriptional repressor) of toxin-antitoxin stability system